VLIAEAPITTAPPMGVSRAGTKRNLLENIEQSPIPVVLDSPARYSQSGTTEARRTLTFASQSVNVCGYVARIGLGYESRWKWPLREDQRFDHDGHCLLGYDGLPNIDEIQVADADLVRGNYLGFDHEVLFEHRPYDPRDVLVE